MTSTTRRTTLAGLAAAGLLPQHAFGQDAISVRGTILGRSGNHLTLRSGTGRMQVRILDGTAIQSTAGPLNVRKQNRLPTELIAGLPVEVKGNMQGNVLVASSILFNPDDLKAAQQARAAQGAAQGGGSRPAAGSKPAPH